MKKRIFALFLAAAMTLLPTGSGRGAASAAEPVLPSLFHNEEPWYKDAVAPLVFRDGKYYLPAELLSMFDGIVVTVPREDNLLIQNTATGWYLSVLFRERDAAENGRIIEDVGVFRDSGMYYVEAGLACGAIGLETEFYTAEDGRVSLRVSDGNRLLSMKELLETYLPSADPALPTEPEETPETQPEEAAKRIHVICTTSDGAEPEYSALKNLEESGVRFTRFLDESASLESILRCAANGAVGLTAHLTETGEADLEALRRMNDRLASLVRLRSRLVYTTGSETADETLRQAGYRVICPDFRLSGGEEAEELFDAIRKELDGETQSCVLLLEDCWNSAAMAELLRTLNPDWYAVAGLTD